ncbi:hypothetical protein WN944_009343 [Citrus x changshan-huyou]|uniref:Uncharacterized protein n=1 Tax=Citrus x changshan-huyou TaxID=2935761 RepID=A0AAP0QZR0_9ROSI
MKARKRFEQQIRSKEPALSKKVSSKIPKHKLSGFDPKFDPGQTSFSNKLCMVVYTLSLIKHEVRDQGTTFTPCDPTIATLFATYSANDFARSNYGPQSKTLRKCFLGKMISNASLDACYGLRKQENPLWVDASMLALGDEGTNLGAELKYKLVEIILLMLLWTFDRVWCQCIAWSYYGSKWRKLHKFFEYQKISNVSLDGCYGLRKQEAKNSIWDFYNNNKIGKPIDIGELNNVSIVKSEEAAAAGNNIEGRNKDLVQLLLELQGYNLGWNQHHNYNGGMDNGIIDTASTSNRECTGRTKSGRGHRQPC